MKKIITTVATILLVATMWAQAPEKMSYQAIIRNTSNNLVTNQGVGIQVSILKGGASGTAVFVETHNVTTNINGLVSLEIGTGTLVSGDFTTIDWGTDTYFIKTETDPTGGTNYTITGTSQLMSVPYALHAKTADNFTGTINETDPIFGASVASGITAADTANWNNHTVDTHIDSLGIANLGFNAGSITTETDPTFTASPAAGITNTLMNNWSIAYTWGNHANAGYLTSFTEVDGSVTNELQNLTVSGNNLTISGGNTVTLPTNTSPWTISGSNIYRTGTGKVGINTSTPLATLDVDGDIRGTSFKLLNVGNVGNRFKIGTNANGIDTDIEYATGWLTFMPNPANVAFALDNNGNAIMGLGTNKVGVGTTAPTEKLEVNGSIKITDGTQGVGKVLTSDVNGKATWKRPVDNVITTPVITRGALPVGSSCPPGGNYTAAGSVLEPGVYMYTLYSCSGQIGQVVSGFNISIVFLSGTGDATGTWHNFNMGDCGNYYTGVVRVTSTSNVAVRYSSHGGSSFTVPGANAEQVVYIKIN